MKKHATSTVIVALAARVVRADFAGAPNAAAARIWQAPRKPGSGLPEAVRQALALGGWAGARVWVLAEDFWAQSLSLPTAQTDRLAPQELADALAFEVEPFSNLPPGETVVGVRGGKPENGSTPFWVVEGARTELVALQEIVARAGGQFGGASHPGGLPLPLGETPASQPWRRVEKWQNGWLAATGDGRGGVAVQNLATSQLGETSSAWTGAAECLAPDSAVGKNVPLEDRVGRRFALDDEAALRLWLAAWARAFDGAAERPALLFAPALPAPFARYVKAGAAAAAAALALCLLHAAGAHVVHARAARQVDALRASVARIERAERENSARRQEIEDLRNKKREYQAAAELLARQRQAFPLLLRSLATVRTPDVVIRELRRENDGCIRIAGLGMTPNGVDDWAERLGEALRPGGWVIAPAGKTAQGILDDSGPWQFVLRATQPDLADRVQPAAAPEESSW